MTRAVIKYVPYQIRPDETAEHEFEARCVFGDEEECGAESGVRVSPSDVDKWMHQHTQATRHNRYRRMMADYQLWHPTEQVPPPVQPGQTAETIPS